MRALRTAVKEVLVALAKLVHRAGFENAEQRILALEEVNDRLPREVAELPKKIGT